MDIDPTAAPDTTYASYPSLIDRTVLITGGADGIGAGMVEEFVEQGSRVAFVDIDPTRAAETLERCASLEPRHAPLFHEVDLVDIPATQQVIARVLDELGSITVLVNNAASD